MISKAIPTALLLSFGLGACAARNTPPPTPDVKRLGFQAVADSVVHFALANAQWGVEVWDQGRNQAIYSRNAYVHFVPASNTKLVVATAALGILGPDWRYQTPFMLVGAVGDTAPRALIIKGKGDPTMSERFHGYDLGALDKMADSLRAQGVRRIAGDVIIDATYFQGDRIHSSWQLGDLPWYYAAPTAAFGVGEGATRLIARGDTTHASPAILDFDAPLGIPVVNRVRVDSTTKTPNVDADYHMWPDTLMMSGTVPLNRADTSWMATPDPETYAARALIAALQKKGITVTGGVRIIRAPADAASLPTARLAFTWTSVPVSEIVAVVLKPSQNWVAEQLLKTLGAERGSGGTWSAGLAVERRYLIDVARVDSTAFALADASGLSTRNVISPNAFVMILEHARRAPWSAAFRNALPKPGMKGATLSNRLGGLETRVQAKTGSLSHVASLSGFVTTENGREVTFSILTNAAGRPSLEMRRGIDAIVQAIAREKNVE